MLQYLTFQRKHIKTTNHLFYHLVCSFIWTVFFFHILFPYTPLFLFFCFLLLPSSNRAQSFYTPSLYTIGPFYFTVDIFNILISPPLCLLASVIIWFLVFSVQFCPFTFLYFPFHYFFVFFSFFTHLWAINYILSKHHVTPRKKLYRWVSAIFLFFFFYRSANILLHLSITAKVLVYKNHKNTYTSFCQLSDLITYQMSRIGKICSHEFELV